MKAIGIVRRLDQLGRIVIPREILKNMAILLQFLQHYVPLFPV